MPACAAQAYEEIITWTKDPLCVLRSPTTSLNECEWDLARSIAKKLIQIRETILGGGAGLAAPQIGSNRSIFIFTPDRTTEGLKVAINPVFEPIDAQLIDGEEACFSIPLRCTKIKRWKTIKAKYQDLQGNIVEEILDDFSSKVFQHEIDHLKGKLTLDHETARVLTFSDPEAFIEYMKHVHLEDSKSYRARGLKK
ncbi:MAG: peptide deformylase [Alphaproteobacteria bacterium]|nr:peptide deformylase [Alphaproteobacteria bacterium]